MRPTVYCCRASWLAICHFDPRTNLHWWPNVFSSSAHFKCFRFFFKGPTPPTRNRPTCCYPPPPPSTTTCDDKKRASKLVSQTHIDLLPKHRRLMVTCDSPDFTNQLLWSISSMPLSHCHPLCNGSKGKKFPILKNITPIRLTLCTYTQRTGI